MSRFEFLSLRRVGNGVRCAALLAAIATLSARAEAGQEVTSEAEARIAHLRAEIARHDALYFEKADPQISDAAYDRLKQELTELERKYPPEESRLARATSPHSAPLAGPRTHREPMLSLEKAYTEEDLRKFHAAVLRRLARGPVSFVVEPKYDGVAISLVYEKGFLTGVFTRGDGRVGENVTKLAGSFAQLPMHLQGDVPALMELRAEAYVDDAEFARLNAQREAHGSAPFAHPRNLAAGILNASVAAEDSPRRLAWVVHGWGAWEGGSPPDSQQAFYRQLQAWGLPCVVSPRVVTSVEEAWQAVQTLAEERRALGFPIDGAVVKLDAVDGRAELGASEHAPRWAIACKFQAGVALTRIRSITVQVGRTGVLTPVAELDPVILDGAQVSRATLHNRAEIEREDYREGDFVEVERAGDVIPAVVGVRRELRPPETKAYRFPERCPSCQGALERKVGGVTLRCVNAACPAQRLRRLEHFASRNGVGIDGFGPALIGRLFDAGLLKRPSDFYRLRHEDLDGEGIGAERVDRLVMAVSASRHAEAWRFIAGLGIPQIGTVNSRKLAGHCRDLVSFAQLTQADAEKWIGPSAASSLIDYLHRGGGREEIQALVAAGIAPRSEDAPPSSALAGKVVVFTGALPGLTRAEAAELVRAAGGVVKESVSAETDYLVSGTDPGRKRKEAQERGVTILSAAEFVQMLP